MSQYLTEKDSTDNLLPCGNCGGEPEWRDGSSTAPYIRCKKCGMRTPSSRSNGYQERLTAIWNRRVRLIDCSKAEHDAGGCLGFQSGDDDEPIEQCKTCQKYTSYGFE